MKIIFYFRKLIRLQLLTFSKWYLNRWGIASIKKSYLYPWQISPNYKGSYNKKSIIPKIIDNDFNQSNPRLKYLRKKYSDFQSSISKDGLWTKDHIDKINLTYFRGDNPYIFQKRGFEYNILAYAITYFWIKSKGDNNYFIKCKEDQSFGVFTHNFGKDIVSRDLLDSFIEMDFLQQNVFNQFNDKISILDIGSGYGRLAYRATTYLDKIEKYYCTDAIAESTFLSEFYIDYYNIENKVSVIPFHKSEKEIDSLKLDLVVNIHSFSEMNIQFIEFWLDIISKNKIRFLFIVPNAKSNYGKKLESVDGINYKPEIEIRGYKEVVMQPKYDENIVQNYGLNPTHYFLFEYIN
tara:strand:+ start:4075 stop:5124 length:1050 start_codon:yes stop_codon:yes gene_type:complete